MDPALYIVQGSQGLAIPAALGAGSPSSSAPVTWQFPTSCFVAGILAFGLPDAGMPVIEAQSAQLGLVVTDEQGHPLISDGRSSLIGTGLAPVSVPLLTLSGRSFRPFALQRPVAGGDKWIFTVQNVDTAHATTLAGIFLYIKGAQR